MIDSRMAYGALLASVLILWPWRTSAVEEKAGKAASEKKAVTIKGERQAGHVWVADPKRGWIRAEERDQRQSVPPAAEKENREDTRKVEILGEY
ncbi:MAG TPA: hypothetical protein VIE39_02115 [Thermoanaerobaculia bacterium]|jgi:hypothetical protein